MMFTLWENQWAFHNLRRCLQFPASAYRRAGIMAPGMCLVLVLYENSVREELEKIPGDQQCPRWGQYRLVLASGIVQSWYQQYLVPGATVVRPTLSFPVAPLPGVSRVSRGQDTSSTGQVLQSSSQWELITLSHVWEGGRDALCVLINVMQLSIWGFAKLDFISLPQPLPWKLHPHFSHGWLIVKTKCFFS